MTVMEPNSVEDQSGARTQLRFDFSVVRGFQVVGAKDRVAAQKASSDKNWRDALRLELESRAARFHQAVDAAIVLSNDGIIRWLGDPVARLALGANILNPGAVILADETLPPASQEIVKNRIDLWLASTTRRLLGPLFALEAMQGGSEVVCDLASKLSRSFGILEREPIRRQINALAQNERAELRKHGVRFGAYYIFVPALIKPAPRTLALHLWSLQAPGDPDGFLKVLGPLASSGRTSLPLDEGISRENYRIAGYRPCGERIVRVDVVERLSGIIRAAIVVGPAGIAPKHPSHRTSNGFIVNGQMTSLTGCSGDEFGSILRSMGFQSIHMSRSELFGSPPAIESSQKREIVAPMEMPGLTAHDQATPLVACENVTSVDLVLASPVTPPADGSLADIAPPNMPGDTCRSGAESGAESASAGISRTSSEGAKNADVIVVWRPERRALSHCGTGRKIQFDRSGPLLSEHLRIGTPGRLDDAGRSPVSASERPRNKNQQSEPFSTLTLADARKAATRPPLRADRLDNYGADEKHRQTTVNRDMPRSHAASGQPPRAKVDPNSPFAKLLELRSLLEGQANKRP